MNATSGSITIPTTERWAMSNCEMCGGRGVIRYADVYKNHRGNAVVVWDLATTVRCGCQPKEAA